ncbi:MAG: hypothetical protein Q9195_000163 [Heterodermia aff. obscurata]
MLDENLPTFYLRPSTDQVRHNASVLLSHHGSDPTPAYSIRHPDPSLPASRNRYAVALYDSYIPDVLFGEVLLIPKWTQPTPTKEELRLNNGVPPPPQPLLPTEFTIQLYNPDQQVVVRAKPGSWNTSPSWEFEMPQQSFRQPSSSSLDRTQSDPTASETTPKVVFRWKKEGKLSKDHVCSIAGKSTNLDGSKRKHREPDIIIALFKRLSEITIYEPNLYRAEMEDPKGLEVVLLLGAIVIREVFNGQLHEVFNISENRVTEPIVSQALSPKIASVPPSPNPYQIPQSPSKHHTPPKFPPRQTPSTNPGTRPPPTDPRTQWEIDAETARLQKQISHEEHRRRRAEEAETRRVKKMLEAEEREAARLKAETDRRKRAEIDRETERLRREFDEEVRRAQQGGFFVQAPVQRPHSAQPVMSGARPQRTSAQRPYLQPLGEGVQSISFGNTPATGTNQGKKVKGKKSFWGLRGSGESQGRLVKKSSSVF